MTFKIIENQPKYRQIKSLIIEKIRKGLFPDDSFLPSENELMKLFGVCRNTIRTALKELRAEGVLVTKQGQASRICIKALKQGILTASRRIAWIDHGYIGLESPVYFDIFKVVSFYAEQKNIQINFISLNNSVSCEAFLSTAKSYIGSIITGVTNSTVSTETFKRLEELNNLICIDNINNSPAKMFIGTDNYSGAKKAVQYLINKGHRKIVFLGVSTGYYTYSPFRERLKGYQDAMSENALSVDSSKIIISDEKKDFYDIRPLIEKTLEKHPDTDAFFAITDQIAIDTIYALKSSSFKIPFDISVIGFDGLIQGQNIIPRLTTIKQPCEEIGRLAIEMIINKHENHCNTDSILLQPELIIGESVYERQS